MKKNDIQFFSAQRQTGITLIELLITMSILAILVTVSVPSFNKLITHLQLVSVSNNINNMITTSRLNAINKGHDIVLCKKSAPVTQDTPNNFCSLTTNDWNQGLLVFQDDNNDNTRNVDEEITQQLEPLSKNITLNYNNGAYVHFTPEGVARNAGTFTLCSPFGEGKEIIINFIGRTRIIDTDTCP